MHFSFWEWLGIVLVIICVGTSIIEPICKCIYKCYRARYAVFKVEDDESCIDADYE